MAVRTLIFRTQADWEEGNPVLPADAIGVEAVKLDVDGSLLYQVDPDSGRAFAKIKNGDGSTPWAALLYEGLLILSNGDLEFDTLIRDLILSTRRTRSTVILAKHIFLLMGGN
jgi:hypothetical protein